MRAVAQRIKQERERQGKSTIEMAHILNIATNTATNITNNNYYADNNMQSQIDRIEKAAHAGRLGAMSQMDRIEEQNKLLLERMEHLNEKIDFLMIIEK